MAVVVYRCDVCKREIELERNIRSLETIGRCIITSGCRGSLYQIKIFPDFTRARLPDSVTGLEDWQQRRVLYNHTQAIERDEWNITHNLGSFPIVSVYVNRPTQDDPDHMEEVTPTDVQIVSEDVVILQFERPYSGIAQLVGRQSDPDLLQPTVRTATTVVQPLQISNNGEITIATLVNTFPNALVGLQVQYNTPTNTQELVEYTVDDQPSILSPWVDFDKAVIRGKVYTIRSFQALVPRMTDGTIESGSTFQFLGVDASGTDSFATIQQRNVLILLASDPYEAVDKIRNQYIDVTDVSEEQNPFSFYFDSGEFFAQQSIARNVYPLIQPV